MKRDNKGAKKKLDELKTEQQEIKTNLEKFISDQEKEILAKLASKNKIVNYLKFWEFKNEKDFNTTEFVKRLKERCKKLEIEENQKEDLIRKARELKNLSGENTQTFITLHEEFLKINFDAFPVRNIINFSTFIKPPGLDKPVDIFYGKVEGYDKNDSYLLKDSLEEKEKVNLEYLL